MHRSPASPAEASTRAEVIAVSQDGGQHSCICFWGRGSRSHVLVQGRRNSGHKANLPLKCQEIPKGQRLPAKCSPWLARRFVPFERRGAESQLRIRPEELQAPATWCPGLRSLDCPRGWRVYTGRASHRLQQPETPPGASGEQDPLSLSEGSAWGLGGRGLSTFQEPRGKCPQRGEEGFLFPSPPDPPASCKGIAFPVARTAVRQMQPSSFLRTQNSPKPQMGRQLGDSSSFQTLLVGEEGKIAEEDLAPRGGRSMAQS